MAPTGPGGQGAFSPHALEDLVLHPSEPGSLELRIWLSLRREPGQSVLELSSRLGRHRKSVARAVANLTDQRLLRKSPIAPNLRDPSTGRLLPARYHAVDPPCP